ncbi:hypothetical protein FSP39_002337 [Pinctada imbricata]|uniref:Vitellogenin domain-containing protein n=1 Tax=Pinctada imbricata TaxID=66713 RepID=A0AA89BIL2_PINIB|nr:hypothetical protein FSP39_002337 [Pinctada imbricata]
MMGTVWFPLVSLVVSLTGSGGYFYEPGYDHYYTYSSKSNLLEMHDVTTIMKFRVRPINHTSDGSSIQQLHLDSFIQRSESGYISPDGLVSSVHYHPKDDQEVVSLKKVLTSTLSGRKLDVHHDTPVTYTDIDHAGNLDHVYRVHRKDEGFMVTRYHQSSDKVKRLHNKMLHYDHSGTVHYGEADDSITLHNETKKRNVRRPLQGEVPVGDSSSGEFPTIASSSKSHVKLTLKRKHSEEGLQRIHDEAELIEDTILILMIEKEKKPLQEVNTTINTLLRCIHSYENHYAPNRTDCVMQLNDILTNLKEEDYNVYAENEVTTLCKENDTICAEQKKLFVDLIARKGDNYSQSLVVKHFLRNEEAIADHVHRCLFHAIAIEKPTMELIEAVEDMCFGVNNELHRGEKLGKTQRRACLTMGALAKIIVHTHNDVAHRMVEKLETWLNLHNETHSKPIISRRKRSVKDIDPIRSNHVVTKMVLLHAIGNAGMERSRDHILSYMQPNQGVLAWRRAAVHGLRHFSCHESANALFVSSVHDDNDIIREEALAAYKEHPKGKVLKEEHKYVVLSKSYTYPTVMRLRRDIFEASFDLKNLAIHFAIRVPGIDWQKTIGTDAIGAGFGLVIRNQMELELSPLSGHFEIDVYNTAYAEAHVGLINLQIDIFRALMCYQGHIGYDLNVLKDFGINDIQDIVHIMDKITQTFVDPVKLAVETFKKIINTFKNGGIQKLFNAMVEFVKNLPHTLETMIKRFVQFVIKTVKYGGIPWVNKIKDIIKRVRTFFEELQDDIMGFYHSVVDAVTIQVPYIGKKLMDAISSIVSSMKRLLSHPMQALSGLSRSVMEIKMSISMFITVKNQLLDALFFLTGKSPFWQNFGEELQTIIDEIKDLVQSLFSAFSPKKQDKVQGHSMVTDGISSSVEQNNWIKNLLKAEFDVIMEPLAKIMKFADPFIQIFKDILDIIHGVKNAYLFVKDTVEKAKSTVQKLFGPKFNIKFPAHRREDKPGCGPGVWPTTTNGLYETTGVDVMLGRGSKVRNPVNGMVYKKSDQQVLIKPSDPDFMMYEIIIDNVGKNIGVVSTGGSYIESGKEIGKALRSQCSPNFIHVAIRKAGTTDYVDPSQFLDRLVPVPQWIEECNDHFFKHIGQVFESGELDEEGAQEEEENLERGASDRMKEFENMKPEAEPPYMPEGMEQPNPGKNIGDAFKDSMGDALKRMGDIGQMITGKKSVNILDIIDLNKYTIRRIQKLLKPPLGCNVQLDELVHRLSEAMRKTPKQHPGSLSIPTLRTLLKNKNDKLIGDTQSMLSNLLCQAEKDCPKFKGTIAQGYSHSCTAHKDCQGIKCGVEIKYGSEVKYINVELRVDSCKRVVYVITQEMATVPLDGEDHQLILDRFENSDLNATLIVNGDEVDGYVVVSLSGTACSPGYSSCTVETEVLIDTKFSPSGPCNDEAVDPGVVTVLDMSLEEFQVYISFYHMMNRDVLCLFNTIRDFLMDEIFKDPRKMLQLMGVELDAKMDFCVSVDLPIPPLSITFFDLSHLFMVGPVPLRLGFGAGGSMGLQIELGFCILSLTAKVTVTPWLGGKVWGSLAIDIGFARGGIKLIGYLLETRFPTSGSLGFSKFPLDVVAKMDLEVVKGPKTKLRISGTYKNYERLGIGQTSYIEYNHLNLTHGTNYYMNAEIGNVLGYKAYLTSYGTMVDFTPPKTGPLGEGYTEEMRADKCSASILQKDRCIDVTWQMNHRYIKDGKGARTVFNGHKPLEDQLYTISNHYTSVNFDGFHDEESGIFAYTWAVGRTVCGTDIVSFRDPHALLFSPKYWTYSGYKKDLHLEDGKYYVTVQALNNVVHGGALVTTVCHSTPFTVDTTPPVFAGVTQIMFDEDFDILGIYFRGHDVLSKVSRVDFGLGKTKYDVQVRGYSPHPYVDREDTYIGIEELGLEPGVPAWIRLRLVNNVELFTAGHGDDPILIDRTAPVPGTVLDGSVLKRDLTYQASDSEICAQWITFFDPESGISQYMWGVGTIPGTDNVVKFHNFTHSQKESCAPTTLNHNTSYYSTVIAFNSALNVKNINKTSDGESGIAKYEVKVTISNDDNHYEHVNSFGVETAISFSDHSLAMKHNDKVDFEITAYNGAGLTVKNQSDGFRVDHTPPELAFLRDSETGERFQSDPSSLTLNWKYDDS